MLTVFFYVLMFQIQWPPKFAATNSIGISASRLAPNWIGLVQSKSQFADVAGMRSKMAIFFRQIHALPRSFF